MTTFSARRKRDWAMNSEIARDAPRWPRDRVDQSTQGGGRRGPTAVSKSRRSTGRPTSSRQGSITPAIWAFRVSFRTRGDRPEMFRTEPPTISAYSGVGEAEECNARFRKLPELDEILVSLDLPTRCGRDFDDEMSVGEFGAVGVGLDTCRLGSALRWNRDRIGGAHRNAGQLDWLDRAGDVRGA